MYDLVDDILNTMDNKRLDVKEPVKPAAAAGDGIRSLETSGVFRTLNFELYTRPNKWVMAFGLTAITGCLGYLAWMKAQHRDQGLYTAIDDQDQLYVAKRRNKWD